ncbi:aldehyde dehydrogenase family protein, partial [Streptomyces sp. NPDC059627]
MTTDHGYPAVRMHIAGEWCQGGSGRTAPVVNPATEGTIGEVPLATPADLDRALEAAEHGFRVWRATSIAKRSAILDRAADLIAERAADIGRVMTLEQGKTLAESTGEARRTADTLRWHVEDARRAYGRIIPSAPGTVLTVRREPIGPVAAFDAWNFAVGG